MSVQKHCSKCERYLDVTAFASNTGRPDGLQHWCRSCQAEAYKRKREAEGHQVRERKQPPQGWKYCPGCGDLKLLSEYHKQRSQPDGVASRCKLCRSQQQKAQYVRSTYGLTEEQAAELILAYPVCPLCQQRQPKHIDHDHRTGAVRGYLCENCNMGLGQFGDDVARLRRAAGYLEGA